LRTQFAIAVIAAALAAIAAPSHAADTAQQANMKSCAANWNGMSATDKSKTSYKAYMSTCLKAPAATTAAMTSKPAAATPAAMTAKPAAPAAAMKAESGSAKCKDGKTVQYAHRSGTCSGHGGVATWM
jgi:hypothetical protein